MSKVESTRWLIVDAFLLACSIVLLLIDLLSAQDVFWAIAALSSVFIFSTRLGRDIRRRRAKSKD